MYPTQKVCILYFCKHISDISKMYLSHRLAIVYLRYIQNVSRLESLPSETLAKTLKIIISKMCPFYKRYKIHILCIQTRYIEMHLDFVRQSNLTWTNQISFNHS